MLNFKKNLLGALIAAGIGLTAMSSFAQMPPPGHAPSAEQQAKFEQMHAKHQAKLHDKLKITAAQEEAWKTFISKTMPVLPASPPPHMSKDEWSKLTTPQRLDRMQEFEKMRQEHMAQRIVATKEFYAVLSPEQQKVFDDEFRKMEKRHFMHHFGHGEGHGHDMGDAPGK